MGQPEARVLVIAEADYCYGVGTLRLRVERIGRDPVPYAGDTFYTVEGVELSRSGAELRRREVLVRARRLRSPPGAPDGTAAHSANQ